jgi:hypothetical protein
VLPGESKEFEVWRGGDFLDRPAMLTRSGYAIGKDSRYLERLAEVAADILA